MSSEVFKELSIFITGFSKIEIERTDRIEEYNNHILEVIGQDHYQDLLESWKSVDSNESKFEEKLWTNDKYRPILQNLITLWYIGTWKSLPENWYEEYDKENELDQEKGKERVLSVDAYKEGLIWDTLGTHPLGAKPPGYGSWALKPE